MLVLAAVALAEPLAVLALLERRCEHELIVLPSAT